VDDVDELAMLAASQAASAARAAAAVAAAAAAVEVVKRRNEMPIYRLGSLSNANLTPREKDLTGLSFTTIKPSSGKYGATTIGAVNGTGVLVAVKDGSTHVSVTPANASQMPEWIQSRPTAAEKPHQFTRALRAVVVPGG
jgi:hypothetical protein